MKQEWLKIIDVHPAVLYKDDVVELVRILTECDENKSCVLSIKFEYEGLQQTLSSIEELEKFSKDIPTDRLSIDVTTWNEKNNIVNGISATMYHNYINYQIHSYNEAWFLGKIAQLTSFFKKRKPWYSLINKVIPFLSPSLIMSGFYLSLFSIKADAKLSAGICVSFTILMVIISYFSFRGKLFPYVRIYPSSRRKRIFTYELVSTIIAVLALIVSIAGTILIPILSKKP